MQNPDKIQLRSSPLTSSESCGLMQNPDKIQPQYGEYPKMAQRYIYHSSNTLGDCDTMKRLIFTECCEWDNNSTFRNDDNTTLDFKLHHSQNINNNAITHFPPLYKDTNTPPNNLDNIHFTILRYITLQDISHSIVFLVYDTAP